MNKVLLGAVSVSLLALAACSGNTASVNTDQPIFDAMAAATTIDTKHDGFPRVVISASKFIEVFNNHRDRALCVSLANAQSMPSDELLTELRRHQRDYPSLVHSELCGQAADEIERLRASGYAAMDSDRGNLTKLAAECHRAKWEFDLSEDYQPSKPAARQLIKAAFNALHRIGDLALKLRDASAITSTGRRGPCQCCGETKDLKCGPSRFGAETWACADCWEPNGAITRPERGQP